MRYRLGTERGMHLTTVAFVVDENPLAAPQPEKDLHAPSARPAASGSPNHASDCYR